MALANRLCVTGSRRSKDKDYVWQVLDAIDRRYGPVGLLIQGAGGDPDKGIGVDILAALWAVKHRIRVDEYQAEWEIYGNPAGPIRNRRMVKHGRPTLGVAFPGDRGTKDCLGVMRKAGIQVIDLWTPGGARPNFTEAINLLDRNNSRS